MSTSNSSSIGTSRREFLKVAAVTAGAVAAPFAATPAVHAAGSDIIKLGLIGCGGRGTGAAGQALEADKNTALVAMADAFPDRLDKSLQQLKRFGEDRIKVTPDRCFTGFDAYKKLIASDVDVVLLCSPPGFRPAHIQEAVTAGKHIFAEKPMAVDAPGVRSVIQSVEQARRKNLTLVAGFNSRYSYAARALLEKIHEGAIGDMVALYTTFNTGSLWMFPRRAEWSDLEWQVRNWYYFTWLSGDHLVEQAVHNCDKLVWAMKEQPPARAMAIGGRQVRTEPAYGHIYDHFGVVYEWANGTRGFLFARQQDNCANDVSNHFMGTRGTADEAQSCIIKGANPWKYEGPENSGHQHEHVELFAALRAGKPIDNGDRMIKSTLTSIMGRMAAYTGKVITWEQAMNSQENLMPAKLEWGPIPTPLVAIPGKTKFF